MSAGTGTRSRLVVITTTGFEVACPKCGEPQPNPENGSHIWVAEELKKETARQAKRACVSCDEIIILHAPNRATITY